MENELELRFNDEAGVYLPQVVAEENRRKANEFERLANEEARITSENERIANEEARIETMEKIEQEAENIIDEMNSNLKKISYTKQYKARYETTKENEHTFNLPEQYTETSMLDVRVNGFTLDETLYSIDLISLTVTLTKPLDIGAVVEIVVTRLTTAQIEDYDSLKGESGVIPVKGVDYFTEEDKAELVDRFSNTEKTEYESGSVEGESLHITGTKQDKMSIVPMANTTQESREGYNLLNLEKYFYDESNSNVNNGTITIENGIIKMNGTNATATVTAKSKNLTKTSESVDVLPSGTYYFGVNTNGYYEDDLDTLVQFTVGVKTLAKNYILTQWYYPCSIGETVERPLLISKDSTKTTYEQFGATPSIDFPSEIKSVKGSYGVEVVNKNFLDKDKIEIGKAWNNTTNANRASSNLFERSGDVTISVANIIGFNFARVILTNETKSINSILKSFTTDGNVTLPTSHLPDYTHYVIEYEKSGISESDFENVETQIEEGLVATGYTAHQKETLNLDFPEGIELNKIGDISDYIEYDYIEDETGYKAIVKDSVKHIGNIKECVFTGNELGWYKSGTNLIDRYGNTSAVNKLNIPIKKAVTISNYFKYYYDARKPGYMYVYQTEGAEELNIYIDFAEYETTTVNDFKAFLQEKYNAGTPIKMKYVTTTPIETPITDETFIAQLEALLNAQAYFGVTNVMTYATDSTQAPLVLSAEYFKSNRIRIENLESNTGTGSASVDLTAIYNAMYPIGRGFIDFTNTDYSKYLGFTWQRELVGMFPVGYNSADADFNTIGKTGGEKTHTLTVEEMPSHTHTFTGSSSSISGNAYANNQLLYIKATSGGSASGKRTFQTDQESSTSNLSVTLTGTVTPKGSNENTGGGQAHNNLPPYQVVAYWKRIA